MYSLAIKFIGYQNIFGCMRIEKCKSLDQMLPIHVYVVF